jgi:hypothetical protein
MFDPPALMELKEMAPVVRQQDSPFEGGKPRRCQYVVPQAAQ